MSNTHNLISTQEAALRCAAAGRPVGQPAVRVWLRKLPGLGRKIAGRWVVDARRLDEVLGAAPLQETQP